MTLMKITRHILFLLLVSGLLGQIEQEKKPKTFLFGLIKIKSNSPYEKGAWIDKWIHAREFALPVYFAPIEERQSTTLFEYAVPTSSQALVYYALLALHSFTSGTQSPT